MPTTTEKKDGVIVILNYNLDASSENDATEKISTNTANTWQAGRSKGEKLKDTTLGKTAESLFEYYLQNSDLVYRGYDSFRANNLEKHAPFDGLLYNKSHEGKVEAFIKKINNEVTASTYGKVSQTLLADLSNSKIFTVEIKSTRLADRHRNDKGNYSLQKIKADDFLAYPHDLRTTDGDFNLQTYTTYLIKRNILPPGSTIDNLKSYELNFMMDIYVRVYINEEKKMGLIMGFISKNDFISEATIKKMYQRGKSEKAIYLAIPISAGKCVDELSDYLKN